MGDAFLGPRICQLHLRAWNLDTASNGNPKNKELNSSLALQNVGRITELKVENYEYYLAIKRNDTVTHATIRMNLKNIMLRERSQIQKSHIGRFHYAPNRQIHRETD